MHVYYSDVKVVYGEYVAKGYKAKELALASHGYIANDVRDIKNSYIRLGFHLHESRKNLYYKDFGFISLEDYADANFGLDKSALSRCMNVFERFSLRQGGVCKMFLDDRYKDYSYSQLCEMVSMNDAQMQKIKPSMTVKKIRELKRTARKKSEDKDPISQLSGMLKGKRKMEEEKAATTQCPELVEPNRLQVQYLNDFAKYFISCHYDYFYKHAGNRFLDIEMIPGMIKDILKPQCRSWAFCSDGGVGHINLFEEYVQLWDKFYNFSGNFDWIYLATAIQIMWDAAKKDDVPDSKYRELDPGKKVATSQLSDPDPEPQLREKEPDHVQPDLPALKNNDQRKDWLRSYKDWGLWYRDDHINVDYYKYDFDNGARLIVEMYHRKATKYRDAHDEYYYHLLRRPDSEFERFPDSETVLLDFLKYLQKKKNK